MVKYSKNGGAVYYNVSSIPCLIIELMFTAYTASLTVLSDN